MGVASVIFAIGANAVELVTLVDVLIEEGLVGEDISRDLL